MENCNQYLMYSGPIFDLVKWFKDYVVDAPTSLEQSGHVDDSVATENKKPQRKNGAFLFKDNEFQMAAIKAFHQLERNAVASNLNAVYVQEVKYVLAALLDELAVSEAWEGQQAWSAKPLQLMFFGERTAGEGVYKRLSELRQQNAVDVLEIYYLCLQFGFTGIYHDLGFEKLNALQVDLRAQIAGLRGPVDYCLSPRAIPASEQLQLVGRELPFWVIGSVASALVFFMYLGFSTVIEHRATKALHTITDHYQQVTHVSYHKAEQQG